MADFFFVSQFTIRKRTSSSEFSDQLSNTSTPTECFRSCNGLLITGVSLYLYVVEVQQRSSS